MTRKKFSLQKNDLVRSILKGDLPATNIFVWVKINLVILEMRPFKAGFSPSPNLLQNRSGGAAFRSDTTPGFGATQSNGTDLLQLP